jgi:hypothetical protein
MATIPKVLAPGNVGGQLVRSFDGITFATFTPTTAPPTHRNLFYQGGSTIYSIDNTGLLWQTIDFGVNWTSFGVAVPNGISNTNAMFRTPGGTWLVPDNSATKGQIQRSTNNGASWTTITLGAGLGADNINLRYFFNVPSVTSASIAKPAGPLYVGVDDNTNTAKSGLWSSIDDGVTWVQKFNTSTGATTGVQFFRTAFYFVFSSVAQFTGQGGAQFNYAPSTNPDASGAQVMRGDGGGSFFMEGTDKIVRSWSTGGDEFHATEANADLNSWTAGPTAVSNAPSYGGVVIAGDQFFGANVALAHYVVSQNRGTSWTDTGITVGPAVLSIVMPSLGSEEEANALLIESGIPGGIRLPRGLPQGPTVEIEEPG